VLFKIFFLLLFSCQYDVSYADCVDVSDITERWLELRSDTISFDHCYLLAKDGLVVEKDEETNWKAGEWEISKGCEECIFEISSGDHKIEFFENQGECLDIIYDGSYNVDICDCSY